MKIKDLKTLEPYNKIATRAKLCLEVEQRKLLAGGWVDRVLVLDKATLYSYRRKGDGGSVNGWGIGGAEVGAKRPRKDGRFVVLITRPQCYSVAFALNSLHEQTSFLKALSTSGATIIGFYGITLLTKFDRVQMGLKKSLEYQRLTDKEHITHLRILEEKPRKKITVPQLSSRMTDVNWTFSNPKEDLVDHDVSRIDSLSTDFKVNLEEMRNHIKEKIDNNSAKSDKKINTDFSICNAKNAVDAAEKSWKAVSIFESKNSSKEHLNQEGVSLLKKECNINNKHQQNLEFVTSYTYNDSDFLKVVESETKYNVKKYNYIQAERKESEMSKEPDISRNYYAKNSNSAHKRNEYFIKDDCSSTSFNIIPTENTKTKHESINEENQRKQLYKRYNTPNKAETEAFFYKEKNKPQRHKPFLSENEVWVTPETKSINEAAAIERIISAKKDIPSATVLSSLSYSDKIGENFHPPRKFSIVDEENDDKTEIIISGVIGVGERIGSEIIPAEAKLKPGKLLLRHQRQHSERPVSGSPAFTRNEQIDLKSVSVFPVLSKNSSVLVLRKQNKCLKVLQLDSREEQMYWLHKLSDEVVNVTPLTKRNSLTLYPTPSLQNIRRSSRTPSRTLVIENFSDEKTSLRVKTGNGDIGNSCHNDCESTLPKITNQTENESVPTIKTLRRKLAIRRQSRGVEKASAKGIESNLSGHRCEFYDNNGDLSKIENNSNYTGLSGDLCNKAPKEKLREPQLFGNDVSNTFKSDARWRSDEGTHNILELSKSDDFENTVSESDVISKIERNRNSYLSVGSKDNDKEISNNFLSTEILYQDTEEHAVTNSFGDNTVKENDYTNYDSNFRNSNFSSGLNVKNIIKRFNAISENKNAYTKSISNITENKYNILNNSDNMYLRLDKSFPVSNCGTGETNTTFSQQVNAQNLGKVSHPINKKLNQPETYSKYKPVGKLQIKTRQNLTNLENYMKDELRKNVKKHEYPGIRITWSVNALKERFEILSTVSGTESSSHLVTNRNSITKRKQTRKSIRKQQVLEGEIRRSSIKINYRRNMTVGGIDLHASRRKPKPITGFNRSGYCSLDQGELVNKSKLRRSYSVNAKKSVIFAKENRMPNFTYVAPSRQGSYAETSTKDINKVIFENRHFIQPLQIEPEDKILENLSNAFLAKRRLVTKQVEMGKIQDALVRQETIIWSLQAKMNSLRLSNSEDSSGPHQEESISSRSNMNESLKSLERDVEDAKKEYGCLEASLEQSESRVAKAKKKMELDIRHSLEHT